MFWQTKFGSWLLNGIVVGLCAGIFLANHHKIVQVLLLTTGFVLVNIILSYNPIYQKHETAIKDWQQKERNGDERGFGKRRRPFTQAKNSLVTFLTSHFS